MPLFPGMRSEQMSSYLFNRIYIFGGLYNTVSSDMYSYGIYDNQLILQHPNLLSYRANGRAVKLDDSNQVVILGGFDEINAALNSVEIYNFIDSVQFSSHFIQPMNFSRNDLMAVYFYGSIYAFGGKNKIGIPIDNIEKLTFATGIKESESQVPVEFKIEQNYPNPFNLSTIIRYYVPETSRISIKVYNILGKEVADLINKRNNRGIIVLLLMETD